MTKRRIEFSAWGAGTWTAPAYAMHDDDSYEGRAATVAAAIARKSGLSAINVRSDGTALDNGQPSADHYELTMGRPAHGGGWNVEARCWFSIETSHRASEGWQCEH